MTVSKLLRATLGAFQLDNPNSTWEELADHLKDIAEGILATHTHRENLDDMALIYSEWRSDLGEIAMTAALTAPQAKAAVMGGRIMQAAERRLAGEPMELVGIIEELTKECSTSVPLACSSLSVGAPPANQANTSNEPTEMTFSALAALYMAEQKDNVQASTLHETRYSCGVLAKALSNGDGSELNLKTHTREDLVTLKANLLKIRKSSTVNKLLTRLSTVLTWAVNNGYLDRTFDKGLKIGKGAESSRKAFTQEQVETIMDHASTLPVYSWERWALSLGVITGARIGEIYQLTKADVSEVDKCWAIDINDNNGKTLKNKHSKRLVPLVDGAYGFDLKLFLEFVEDSQGRLFTAKEHSFNKPLNEILRTVLGLESGGDLSFHSLRHSMASLMKSKGIAVGLAQDILGHSSQTITFDLYGGNQRIGMEKLGDALKEAFKKETAQ